LAKHFAPNDIEVNFVDLVVDLKVFQPSKPNGRVGFVSKCFKNLAFLHIKKKAPTGTLANLTYEAQIQSNKRLI